MSFVRYCKLVILGILGRLATPVKKDSINLLKTLMFPCMQKINCIPNFGTWTGLAKHIKTIKRQYQLAENLDVYQHAKNKLHRSLLSWDITKILARCYFEYLRHAWLHPSDMTVPAFWILWSLSLQKSTLYVTFFSRYCKNFANLLFRVLWARLIIFTNIDSINL